MRFQLFMATILALLLIGLGFVLGHHQAATGGFLRPAVKGSWTAPSLFWSRVEPLEYSPILNVGVDTGNWEREQKGDLIFPARVGRLHMDKLISGKEALEHAQRLHGDELTLVRVFIPYYCSGDEQATLWVLEIGSVAEASMHLRKMDERIAGLQNKHEYGSFYLQDVEVKYLHSSNTSNYYYRKENKIYWVSLSSPNPAPLFLSFYEQF